MPQDHKKSIKETYDEAMAEVFRIVGSFDSTQAQIRVARQTAKDMSSMLIAHTLDTVHGQTALLSSLIVELNQVIAAVETKPPYTDSVEKLTGLLKKAERLYKSVKKELT